METKNKIRIEKIKKIISTLNMNQSEFSSRMGVSRSYISRVLSGNPTVSDNFINKICNAFGISKEYFNDNYRVEDKIIFQTNTQFTNHSKETKKESAFANSIYSQIDDLISYRGENNIYFQKNLSDLLHHVKNYLICKDDCKNSYEGQEKAEFLLDDIEEVLQEM